MKKRLFIYHDTLELFLLEKKAVLRDNLLHLNGPADVAYYLLPAVKVICCETSLDDPYKLTGKFLPCELLTQCGADLFISSFVYKQQSYRIESGFLGTLQEKPRLMNPGTIGQGIHAP
ncbi:MAG: hypothetical protein WBB19_18915 [Desulforhopalus sp.]